VRRVAAPGFLLAGAVAIATAPGAAGHVPATLRPVTKKVIVADDYYGPSKVTVPRGSTIKWVWPYTNGNSHNVKLGARPGGARRFHSEIAASGFSYSHKLTVPGTYRIYCSLHQTMKMTIVVRH